MQVQARSVIMHPAPVQMQARSVIMHLSQCRFRPGQSSCTLPDAGAGPVGHHAPRSDAGTSRRLCKAWCRWPPCPPPCAGRARAGARAPVAGRARAGPLQLRLPELKQREEDRRHDRRLRDARALRAGRARRHAPRRGVCAAPRQAPGTERGAARAQHQAQSCLAWPASSAAGLEGADAVPAPFPCSGLQAGNCCLAAAQPARPDSTGRTTPLAFHEQRRTARGGARRGIA